MAMSLSSLLLFPSHNAVIYSRIFLWGSDRSFEEKKVVELLKYISLVTRLCFHHVSAENNIKNIKPMVNRELMWFRCSWANSGLEFQLKCELKGRAISCIINFIMLVHERFGHGSNRAQTSFPHQGPGPSYL